MCSSLVPSHRCQIEIELNTAFSSFQVSINDICFFHGIDGISMFLRISFGRSTVESLCHFGTGVTGAKSHGKLDLIFGEMMNVGSRFLSLFDKVDSNNMSSRFF